mgnify:CR=1 FL=1
MFGFFYRQLLQDFKGLLRLIIIVNLGYTSHAQDNIIKVNSLRLLMVFLN